MANRRIKRQRQERNRPRTAQGTTKGKVKGKTTGKTQREKQKATNTGKSPQELKNNPSSKIACKDMEEGE